MSEIASALLHDGVQDVRRIHVLALFRDNATFFRRFMAPLWSKTEEYFSMVEFNYHFLENDSTDETPALLSQFADTRGTSKVHVHTLSEEAKNAGGYVEGGAPGGTDFTRMQRMVFLRNTLMELASPYIDESDWVLLVDTDIIFQPQALSDLMAQEPRKNNIAMICAATKHGHYAKHVREAIPVEHASAADYDIIPTGHYYDVFAFVDKNGHLFYPRCAFSSCSQCTSVGFGAAKAPNNTGGVRDVRSCFGGLCFLDAKYFLNRSVKWDSIDIAGQFSLCEHILFCDRVRSIGGRVCIAENALAYWVNDAKPTIVSKPRRSNIM